MSNGNGHDLLDDDDERMHRATLVAKLRQEAAETCARSEALVERLRMEAPSADAAAYTPREPEPEPEEPSTGLVTAIAALRGEMHGVIATRIEEHAAFVQELLELCAASFAERWTGEVDNLAKTVSIELRELQSAIARSSGRASGEVEALRSEIERGKIQVETLKAEVAELRAELARSQGRRLEAVRS